MRANSTCGTSSEVSTLSTSTIPSNVATVAPTTIGPSLHQTMANTNRATAENSGSSAAAVTNLHAIRESKDAPTNSTGLCFVVQYSFMVLC